MSGGVDSSVAAALLVEAGYDVVGISMRLWGGASGSGCCSLDDFPDARRVAAQLGVPFYVMDFRDVFARDVVAPFVSEYLHGRTPNPCVRCNQFVKFGTLWQRARQLGAQWIATGHYACVRRDRVSGIAELLSAADAAKDQSYFLFAIEPAVLARALFPIGELTKAQVRMRARALRLPVAEKPESQEVCFVPQGHYAAFVERYAGWPAAPQGTIVDGSGRVLGRHDGIHRFTVGQRRGLGVSSAEPLYVTRIDAESGTVRVGPRAAILAPGLIAGGARWLCGTPVSPGTRLHMKIRSRFSPTQVTISDATADTFVARADAGLPAVTPGQAAVLYEGRRVIGGGWIERALEAE
jgi:tRNA-specific 2-thiouridylase